MKKIATLLLAAGLVFGAATGSSAIEFNAKGQWIMNFEYGQGGNLTEDYGRNTSSYSIVNGVPVMGTSTTGSSKVYGWGDRRANSGKDSFAASQRIRLQLDAVASEALSGTVFFEIGDTIWGSQASGGALGTDGRIVEVKRAYLDWMIPDTAFKLRMGLQGIALPSYTFDSSQVFNNDSAAIAASYQFNDNVGITFVWARPYNDNPYEDGVIAGTIPGTTIPFMNNDGQLDNLDMFALIVPFSFNNGKVTPWVTVAMIGQNALGGAAGSSNSYANMAVAGMTPAVSYYKPIITGINATTGQPIIGGQDYGSSDAYGLAYWAGITGEYGTNSAFRFAWDLNYGAYDPGNDYQSREGYYLDLLFEYRAKWGTPGLYAWYSSGDNDNIKDGSERMPSMSADGVDQRSGLAGTGNPYIGRDGVIANQFTGTMGLGVRIKDFSFAENLMHTIRINYIMGNNDTKMADYILSGVYDGSYTDFNEPTGFPAYLTTDDSAIEIGLTTTYKIYDNLTMFVDLQYIMLNMDESTWGGFDVVTPITNGFGVVSSADPDFKDPWNVNLSFVYDF